MLRPVDVPNLYVALLGLPCWTPSPGGDPLLGGMGYSLPGFQAGKHFATDVPDDVAALQALGVRTTVGAVPNHVYVERNQAGLSIDLRLEGAGSYLVIGRVAGLVGSFLILGSGSSVIIADSPNEMLGVSADLIGDGAGLFFGRGCTCYGARCVVENVNSIRVGDGCLFSDRIDLRASDSHTLASLETGLVLNPPASITIEPFVWMGTTVLVLKGTRIGTGSVVGAHSVVTRDVPPQCVAVGSPARIVRQDVSWHRTYPGSMPGHRFKMTASGMAPYVPSDPPLSLQMGTRKGDHMAASQQIIHSRDLVAALYRKLLLREPEALGRDNLAAKVETGEVDLDTLIGLFLDSDEFSRNGPRFRAAYKGARPANFLNEVSQYGEVERLIRHWVNGAAVHRIVVDVGARGRDRSNSYDLLRSFGWRGILVEANPALIPAITLEFAGLDMELVNCAVSDYEGTATLHLGVNDDVSSLNERAAGDWGPIAGQLPVTVTRLGTLLRSRGIPDDFDLLSLDIEGEDIKVLNDVVDAFGYRPRWIIIEASYDFQTRSLDDIPVSKGVKAAYRLADQTEANLILKAIPPVRTLQG